MGLTDMESNSDQRTDAIMRELMRQREILGNEAARYAGEIAVLQAEVKGLKTEIESLHALIKAKTQDG
jgi:hypothetical protein